VINRIRNSTKSTFTVLHQILEKQSELRQMNLSQKRQRSKPKSVESSQVTLHPESLPPSEYQTSSTLSHLYTTMTNTSTITEQSPTKITTTTTTSKSTTSGRRIVSNASIAHPTQDSAGGTRVWASNEKASDIFANILLLHIISTIWPDGITLDWVRGRSGQTRLTWSHKYLSYSYAFFPFPQFAAAAVLILHSRVFFF
jgi:hypothetical protein